MTDIREIQIQSYVCSNIGGILILRPVRLFQGENTSIIAMPKLGIPQIA